SCAPKPIGSSPATWPTSRPSTIISRQSYAAAARLRASPAQPEGIRHDACRQSRTRNSRRSAGADARPRLAKFAARLVHRSPDPADRPPPPHRLSAEQRDLVGGGVLHG